MKWIQTWLFPYKQGCTFFGFLEKKEPCERGTVFCHTVNKKAIRLLRNIWQNKNFFCSVKPWVCGKHFKTGWPVIQGCCSERRVHIFCLCGWQSVYWKGCSLGAHVAACAFRKQVPRRPSLRVEKVFLWRRRGGICVHVHACVSLIFLENLANIQQNHTRTLCVCVASGTCVCV